MADWKDLAKGWGKLVAQQAFGDEGPGLDMDLTTMEQIAMHASRALIPGAIGTMVAQQFRYFAFDFLHYAASGKNMCGIRLDFSIVRTAPGGNKRQI